MPTAGEYIDLIAAPQLGGFVRRGWETLNVQRAFSAIQTAWNARDLAIKTDTALPAGLYESTRVLDFFGILFQDEPSFADDEELF